MFREKFGVQKTDRSIHTAVKNQLLHHYGSTVAQELAALYDLRLQADYVPQSSLEFQDWGQNARQARRLYVRLMRATPKQASRRSQGNGRGRNRR